MRYVYSGFAAVGMVNVVIFIYIVEAFREDAQKEPTPIVGKFKLK